MCSALLVHRKIDLTRSPVPRHWIAGAWVFCGSVGRLSGEPLKVGQVAELPTERKGAGEGEATHTAVSLWQLMSRLDVISSFACLGNLLGTYAASLSSQVVLSQLFDACRGVLFVTGQSISTDVVEQAFLLFQLVANYM